VWQLLEEGVAEPLVALLADPSAGSSPRTKPDREGQGYAVATLAALAQKHEGRTAIIQAGGVEPLKQVCELPANTLPTM
jgi:hypothetical protein